MFFSGGWGGGWSSITGELKVEIVR
jgi:hypothetical protein